MRVLERASNFRSNERTGTRHVENRSDEETLYYSTLIELNAKLRRLEETAHLTVVIVLDKDFSGHLASLIRRSRAGSRLVLAVPGGRLPGLDSLHDHADGSTSLGWDEIVFEREVSTAIAESLRTRRLGERLIIFRPSWNCVT